MDGKEAGISDLIARLDKLERSNRRWRVAAIATLAMVAVVGALGAVAPVPNTIRAHRFDLVDPSGKVVADLGMMKPTKGSGALADEPRLELLGAAPPQAVWLTSRGVAMCGTSGGAISLLGPGQEVLASTGGSVTAVAVSTPLDTGAPGIQISDKAGFETDLGVTGTQTVGTGETQKTSAASIVMFGNDKNHKVIWKAPLP